MGLESLQLETFVDGQELLKRVTEILNGIDPKTISGRDIQPLKLIISDIQMPVINGWETIKKLKELYSRKQEQIDQVKSEYTVVTLQLPYLVIHTANYIDSKTRKKIQQENIDAIVEKPISLNWLKKLLKDSGVTQEWITN